MHKIKPIAFKKKSKIELMKLKSRRRFVVKFSDLTEYLRMKNNFEKKYSKSNITYP